MRRSSYLTGSEEERGVDVKEEQSMEWEVRFLSEERYWYLSETQNEIYILTLIILVIFLSVYENSTVDEMFFE